MMMLGSILLIVIFGVRIEGLDYDTNDDDGLLFLDSILKRQIRIAQMRLIIVPVWDINHLVAELQVSSSYLESNSGRFRCIRNSQLKYIP